MVKMVVSMVTRDKMITSITFPLKMELLLATNWCAASA